MGCAKIKKKKKLVRIFLLKDGMMKNNKSGQMDCNGESQVVT